MSNLNATELRTACVNYPDFCNISSTFPLITNHGDFTIKSTDDTYPTIYFGKGSDIDLLVNYGTITTYHNNNITTYTFIFSDGPGFKALINYGTLSGGIAPNTASIHITNYGTMGGVSSGVTNGSVTVANYGELNLLNDSKKSHFKTIKSLILQAYTMQITENESVFNAFDGNATDNSHLVLDNVQSVSFADANAKMILDFGENFEFGVGYKLDKLIVKADNGETALSVDISRLTARNDIYSITKSGQYFIAKLAPEHSAISNIYKANIRTMNNFYTMSNSMIYPRKSYHSQNLIRKNQNNLVILRERSDRRISKSNIRDSSPKAQNDNIMQDSAIPLKSYESFAYRNESVNRRIQRQNKRNYNRQPRTSSQNQTQNLKENQTFSQNLSQNLNNYYFILTPFFNYNSFAQTGNYNLRGFDYGFLTAFSARVAESNSLGAHFIFSYGTLGDSKDKDLSIKSLNLNVGINYKFDMVWDMYLKARGDFFYFLNQVKTLTMFEAIKPNNLGFGASVIFGKDFNFGKGGVLGLEAGLDYKALKTNEVSLNSQTYKQSLYNLIYVDLGMSYNKYFGNFGLNATLGIKGNITANKLATSKIHISTFNKSVDMMLDNDNFLGYANLGVSYVLNHKDFDMEFSLAYYGNFGDRVISNGGGVEFRVVF